MSGPIKKLVRGLQAVGCTALAAGGSCYLSQDGSRLVEKIYDGEDLQNQRPVADNARAGASAVYVTTKEKALIVYTGTGDVLKASAFDEDEEEWSEAALEGVGEVAVHPQTRLGASLLPDEMIVFYQAVDGSVRSIRYSEKTHTWTDGFSVPGKARTGTPLAVFLTKEALNVSLVDTQGKVTCHKRDLETGEWTNVALNNVGFPDSQPVQSIVVTADDSSYEAYALIGTTVQHIAKDGSSSTIGSVSGGSFVPSSKAESGFTNYGGNYGNQWENNYGGGGGGGGFTNTGGNYGNQTQNNWYIGGGGGGYTYCYPRVRCGPCW
ncbi:hypothetical protein F5Y17DRAFT_113347 [Xylariaceae sp. FL0594]|nr:hypothetical protein F5Y17DRAFT_113347 [Xylariaceae sp. FL0594]